MSDNPANLNNLLSVSETIVGLILTGKQTSTLFNPEKLHGKYQNVLKDIKAGKTEEDLYLKYNNLIQPAKYAAKSVNGMGDDLDWVAVVDKAYSNEVIGDGLTKAEKYVAMGDMDKFDDVLRRIVATRQSSQRLRSVLASDISTDYEPFIKSGSVAWDKHIVGLPTMGTVIIGAKTFAGKTTIAIALMENFMKQYPEREILFVTLEDMAEGWLDRAKVILGEKCYEFWSRIHVMEFSANPEEIIQEASRFPDVGMILLDYVDYLAQEKSLTAYDDAYMKLQMGAKSLAVSSKFRSMPIIVLAQFGKGSYKGGVPTINNLMFTGDAGAYQIMMLYNPNNDFYSDDKENTFELPVVKGKGYLVFWKVKSGFRNHVDAFPGAIQVNWSARNGFDLNNDGVWFSLTNETRREVGKKR